MVWGWKNLGYMERDKFYEKEVLTAEEYNVVSNAFDKAEEAVVDVMDDIRETITGVMEKLWERESSTELVTDSFTIINRFGDITVIDKGEDSEYEESISDIMNVGRLLDILSEMI